MSYNYGREVRRLQNRQVQEDAELREDGVSEFFIEILHETWILENVTIIS